MKKQITTFVAACLLSTTSWAGGIGLFGALWDTEEYGDSSGLGGKIIIGDAPFALEVRGTYFDDLTDGDGPFDMELEAIPVEAGLLLSSDLTENVGLHVGVGAGYYFLDSNYGEVDDEIGIYASGGLSLQILEGMAVFGEAVYRWVNGTVEEDDFGDFERGTDLDLDGIGIHVGLMFN